MDLRDTRTATDGSVSRLRAAIDSGRTREKINWPDPAAAPLGTDEEAAGTPVHAYVGQTTAEREIKARDKAAPRAPLMGSAWIVAAVAVVTAVAVVGALAL